MASSIAHELAAVANLGLRHDDGNEMEDEPTVTAMIYAQLSTAAAVRELADELRGIRAELERIAR
jgi:hypothetical protein